MIAKTDGRRFVAALGPALAALRLALLMARRLTRFAALGALLGPIFRPISGRRSGRRSRGGRSARCSGRCSERGSRGGRSACVSRGARSMAADRCCIRGFGARLAMFTRLATRAPRTLGAATTAFASTTAAAATTATAAVGRLEALDVQAGNLDAGNGRADQLLDRLHQIALGGRRQGEGMADPAGAAGAADAVDVVVRRERHVEIEDVAHVVDVEAARGDVGRHQDLDLAAP